MPICTIRWLSSGGDDDIDKPKNIPMSSSTKQEPVIPGAHHQYGSLHDAGARQPSSISSPNRLSWQASDNFDVQNVTIKAMIYTLIHQQTATIEKTVPWFLENMPASYFKQVPERFRMDHIKVRMIQCVPSDSF